MVLSFLLELLPIRKFSGFTSRQTRCLEWTYSILCNWMYKHKMVNLCKSMLKVLKPTTMNHKNKKNQRTILYIQYGIINSGTHKLDGNQENSLKSETASTEIEQVFQAGAKQFHNQCIILPTWTKIVNIWYSI